MKLSEILDVQTGDYLCVGITHDLTSLKDEKIPRIVTGEFSCSHNKLTSLEGGPLEVRGSYNCIMNELTSLKGAPSKVGGSFLCTSNDLTSLEYAPSEVGKNFICSHNEITSLKNIHKTVKKINGIFGAIGCNITSHVLGILLIEGCEGFMFFDQFTTKSKNHRLVHDIINKYLPNTEGMKAVLKCQEELFAEDLDEYAQL